jgi:superfamily II DNA/RNA helicase
LCNHTALLFSATFKKNVEIVARDILTDPIRIAIGVAGESNSDVTQVIEVLHDEQQKLNWTLQHLPQFISKGNVIIFAGTKNACTELAESLMRNGISRGIAVATATAIEYCRQYLLSLCLTERVVCVCVCVQHISLYM